ncbi:hypothetical protein GC425_04680 [Corynebacterium sp. zg254]|uniref:EndoU domain-containing protein n=1 Tax=Corynebacterium zhongnanshanii TaxID=2768834 RepID=A0ABQ6VEE5_9CORY|nr:EndoU domain-containing protein [Corynebacterium zhongnanshanii]MCR5914168.1 hypothetical protein [Corynebacterium sp. zg254]
MPSGMVFRGASLASRGGADLPRVNRDLQRLWDESGARDVREFGEFLEQRRLIGGEPWPALTRVQVPAYRGDGTSRVFPGESLPADLNRVVAHVLHGWRDQPRRGEEVVKHSEDSRMGHTWDSQRVRASKFPKSWSDQKIAHAVVETLENPEYYEPATRNGRRRVFRNFEGVTVKAEYTVVNGTAKDGSVSVYPVDQVGRKAVRHGN